MSIVIEITIYIVINQRMFEITDIVSKGFAF